MRLNRFLASAGLGSRRSCEELIQNQQITINGVLCTNLATHVGEADVVKAGNRVLHAAQSMTILLNKPAGFICTASDTHDRRTVFDLLPPNSPRLFHVGRLDKESEGLLILTNDGDLALKLTHPRYKVEKEYEVVLDYPFDFTLAEKLLHGMSTPEGWAKVESIHRLGSSKVKVVLRQGLKRQIRLMFYGLGYEVTRLVRTRIGSIEIQSMPPASYRALTQKEIEALLAEGAKAGAEESRHPRKPYRPLRTSQSEEGRGPRPFARPGKTGKPGGSRPGPGVYHREGERKFSARRPYSDRPAAARGPVEEIPFTPRAAREGGEGRERSAGAPAPARKFSERTEERPRRSSYRKPGEKMPGDKPYAPKPGGKPYGVKAGGKSYGAKAGGKSGKPFSGKPAKPARVGPHPFAKFQERRAE